MADTKKKEKKSLKSIMKTAVQILNLLQQQTKKSTYLIRGRVNWS